MNFIEALKEMEKGKIITWHGGDYGLKDGKLATIGRDDFEYAVWSFSNITDTSFKLKVKRESLKSLDELECLNKAFFLGHEVEKKDGVWRFKGGMCITCNCSSRSILDIESWEV